MSLKPGSRLKSAVCDTEVVVVRGGDVVIGCGGAPMTEARSLDRQALDPTFAGGTLMGKRYIDAEGTLELVCTKAGEGSLHIGDTPLQLKETKPLPTSD